MSNMEPKTKVSGNTSHTRYALGRQIHAAEVYPFSSTDGSKIIVCGHDQGLLLVWKGGRSSRSGEYDQVQRHSIEEDTQMSNGEENTSPEEDGSNPTLRQLDLPLGTAVLHLSFPTLQQTTRPQDIPLVPKFLQHELVVGLACSDGSVRLLTIPLDAPSPAIMANKKIQQRPLAGEGALGERLVTIPYAHQNMPRGISIAFAARALLDAQSEEEGDGRSSMEVLVASHSTDLSGTLLIHRIPLEDAEDRFGTPFAWRCRPLSSPACSIDLLVSPSGHDSPKVLMGDSSGSVRIFDCVSSKQHAGNWSLSLFAPLPKISEAHTASLRCARWVLGGSAVAVLTADGGWGIWDVSDGKTGRSISGARPTPFTFSGRVGTVVGGNMALKSSNEKAEARSQLAPMTPGTRKARQEALFLGRTDPSSKRGGISVSRYTNSIASGETDESLVFWHGDSVVFLPSLRTHWQGKSRGSSTAFTASAQGHLRDVPSVSLGGESRISVSAFPSENQFSPSMSAGLQILVAGERSLTFSSSHHASRITPSNLTTANQSRISDQSLLSRRLLDVNGLDRVLDGMHASSTSVTDSSAPGQRRVVFE